MQRLLTAHEISVLFVNNKHDRGSIMRRFALMLLAGMYSVPSTAQTDAAAAFGARKQIVSVSMSPSGNRIAYLSALGARGMALMVVDLAGDAKPKAILAASGKPEQFSNCEWVSDTRIICRSIETFRTDGRADAGFTLFAVNWDGSNLKRVSIKQGAGALYYSRFGGNLVDLLPGDDGAVLIGRQYVPEQQAGSLVSKSDDGYGVDRIDTATLETRRVVKPLRSAGEFISDGRGVVRIMGSLRSTGVGYAQTNTKYSYRLRDKTEWVPLSEYDWITEQGFNPYAVDAIENVAYGFDKIDGRHALVKVALDGSGKRATVFSRPDVDVDDLVMLGRQRRVVGVSFSTEKRQVGYFDPGLVRLSNGLRKALPNAGIVGFTGANSDDSKLIVWMGSDTDPGRYYRLDRKSGSMGELFAERPQLAGYKLAEVKPITYRASDGRMIPGYLTLPVGSSGKNLPAIVMPHGGPGTRDEWGFDWLAQFYVNRGFAVLQPNYRGSAGYGDAWFRNMGFKAWNVAIGDVADAGRWLVQQGIASPSKLAVVGWSYGGYAALQSGVVDPDLFKAIVAIAPVTDLDRLKTDAKDFWNYTTVEKMVGSGPHIDAGSPARNARTIRAPVLLFHGDTDLNVDIGHSRLMADRLRAAGKTVQLREFPDLAHDIADSSARATMLSESDIFLRKALGM